MLIDFKWLITDYLMQSNCLHSVPQVGHDGMVTSLCWGGCDKHVAEWSEKGRDYAQ